MYYGMEHTHTIYIPGPVFEWLAESVESQYRIAEKKIQYQYNDNHYICFYNWDD